MCTQNTWYSITVVLEWLGKKHVLGKRVILKRNKLCGKLRITFRESKNCFFKIAFKKVKNKPDQEM